jgi:hypothetical protein
VADRKEVGRWKSGRSAAATGTFTWPQRTKASSGFRRWSWDNECTVYPSRNGTPVVTFIHPGGHEFDPAATRLIVKCIKEHPAAN